MSLVAKVGQAGKVWKTQRKVGKAITSPGIARKSKEKRWDAPHSCPIFRVDDEDRGEHPINEVEIDDDARRRTTTHNDEDDDDDDHA